MLLLYITEPRCHPDLNGENRQQPLRQIADCLHLAVNRLLCLYQMAALAANLILIVSKKVAKLRDITTEMGVIMVSSHRVASYTQQLRLMRQVFLSHMKLKVLVDPVNTFGQVSVLYTTVLFFYILYAAL